MNNKDRKFKAQPQISIPALFIGDGMWLEEDQTIPNAGTLKFRKRIGKDRLWVLVTIHGIVRRKNSVRMAYITVATYYDGDGRDVSMGDYFNVEDARKEINRLMRHTGEKYRLGVRNG